MPLLTKGTVLEADYSSALTLLLRYPVPPAPHGPITFVEDALYLRRNLTIQAGRHLIAKYSGKSPGLPTSHSGPLSPQGKGTHTPQRGSRDFGRAKSPLRSPGQLLQEAGGIEGILQEAARGVYRRSEQWGLSQALRGAVQGLQAGGITTHKPTPGVRWSLDAGKDVGTDDEGLRRRISRLEDRNKALGKLVQAAMDDLAEQVKNFEQQKADNASNALTLTIAKLQYIQVYLDDSALPLGSGAEGKDSPTDSQESSEKVLTLGKPISPSDAHSTLVSPTILSAAKSVSSQPGPTGQNPLKIAPSSPSPSSRLSTARSPRSPPASGDISIRPLFQSPRPSLAQSSFSWMLGEDDSKPSFVTSSPFGPETDRKLIARGKAGFLFGDDKGGGQHVENTKAKRKEETEDDDGFTLGTLKGVPKGN